MSADKIVIDLTNFKETISARCEPGRHRVSIQDYELRKSKAGSDMIMLWLNVTEGDDKGKVVVDRLTLTENALFRVVNLLTALGIPTPKKRIALDPRKIVGRSLEVDLVDNEYQGRVNSQVDAYHRAPAKAASVEADELPDEVEEVEEEPTGTSDDVLDLPDVADVDLEEIEV